MLGCMSAPLPGFLQAVAPLLDHYGYGGVAFLLFIEDFGLPVPGETILIAASIYAGTGRLNVFVLAAIAIVAAVVGDNIGYVIGHYGGEAIVRRYGKYVFLTPEKLDKTKDFFNRRGGAVVTIARFIDGLRQLNGIIAGSAEMKWRRFLMFNAIGATLWVGTWVTVGYTAGNNIGPIYRVVTKYSLYAGILVVIGVFAFIGRFIWKRRKSGLNTAKPVDAKRKQN